VVDVLYVLQYYMAISDIIIFWLQTIFHTIVFAATLYGCMKIFRAKHYPSLSILLAGILLIILSGMIWKITFLILSGGRAWINYSTHPIHEATLEVVDYISGILGYVGFLLIPIGLYKIAQGTRGKQITTE